MIHNATLAPPPDRAGPDLLAQIRDIVERHGQVEASRRLGVSRSSLLALLAGLAVRPGTLALVESRARAFAAPGGSDR